MAAVETLTSVDQTAYDQAEAMVISMIRSAYPSLDLRRGTVLRELLVRAASAYYALESQRYVAAQQVRSLQQISENPSAATQADVNHILSNFSVVMRAGDVAVGYAYLQLAYNRSYVIADSFRLVTLGGLQYRPAQAYTVTSTPDPNDATQLQLQDRGNGTYYTLVPMYAVAAGAEYTISAGTALNAVTAFDGFVTAEAYADFTGGANAETVAQVLARLPSAIAHRSLESRKSIESILRDPDQGNFGSLLYGISVQGYGDVAQLRDKHNFQGVAMGSRVDIYVRTFQPPATVVLYKTGQQIAPGQYQFTLTAADAPGYYAIRAVADVGATGSSELAPGSMLVLGSYAVTEVRSAVNTASTRHDISATNSVIETCGTVYQQSVVTVSGVVENTATKEFKVELYAAPSLLDIQTYVDSFAVQNVKADHLVRCPVIGLVSMRAKVTPRPGQVLDIAAMQRAVSAYINSRSFVAELTESEILAVLHRFQVLRVDTSDDPLTGFQLSAVLRDAAGIVHTLPGPSLDIRSITNAASLLTTDTCVFAAADANMIISV